ncbi:glycosyltransferase family 2 protein [Jannaschia seohaensis]|uniref:GT2 family glycosyltransferase n=1 Tax=Jannaschia seohaensis TaxID=475081 RepID=A0A2Y9A1X5_9RHOB|nr:glycosyltransferase [Jannaschia seohaensis]PWJ22172.1 GT2 family glycosyltransferase [Jannaschia seohaensis]SSA38450.1 Glycosyltransferase, GT2 family [Jannaschia seohaensis]
MMADPAKPPILLAIASAGRGPVLEQTLAQIASLSDQPDAVWLSVAEEEVAAPEALAAEFSALLTIPLRVLSGPKGLCAQRNAVLDAAPEDAIILFLDDDYLLGDGSVSALRRLFGTRPDVVMATGRVMADGILGPGLDHARGMEMLTPPDDMGGCAPVYNAYGCNMALRMKTAARHGVRFDTDLPLYGWLEDVDFSRNMARYGEILRCDSVFGVHLGTKKGRSRGVPLGYSQLANPIYLIRKGTMSPRRALRLMSRNMMANLLRAPWPEPWVDRVGRLRGNLTALADLARGRLSPRRILDL